MVPHFFSSRSVTYPKECLTGYGQDMVYVSNDVSIQVYVYMYICICICICMYVYVLHASILVSGNLGVCLFASKTEFHGVDRIGDPPTGDALNPNTPQDPSGRSSPQTGPHEA